jgi:ABC-type transporter Mla MlaB component
MPTDELAVRASSYQWRRRVDSLAPPLPIAAEAMEPSVILFVIDGPIDRTDLPVLCDRLRTLLDGAVPGRIVCDVGAVNPDAATVDALARMQLAARRLGCQVWLSHASGELKELLVLMGLQAALPLSDG